jgi:TAT (twin-arginine translocation) pathway signal sequence
MLKSDVNRREFLKITAGAGAALAMPGSGRSAASSKMIGIQVGAISFVDEGTEKVLDVLQERACVNTLFLAVFTYGRGIAGRQIPGQPLPDHGKQEYDLNFHGGNFGPLILSTTRTRSSKTLVPPTTAISISWPTCSLPPRSVA